jgi:hypothetical protein
LEETCRLLAADRGRSDTLSIRFPRAAATEAVAQRVMSAMLQMTKIDIAELERAYAAGA